MKLRGFQVVMKVTYTMNVQIMAQTLRLLRYPRSLIQRQFHYHPAHLLPIYRLGPWTDMNLFQLHPFLSNGLNQIQDYRTKWWTPYQTLLAQATEIHC
jgi:hypothetical protein